MLDEADQMLDLGFLQPIRRIVAHLPKQRQNLFFSATMPGEIGKLAGELLINPAEVSSRARRPPRSSASTSASCSSRPTASAPLLAELFADPRMDRALVFTRTKRGADRVAKYLEAAGVEAAAIHGDKSQGQRERALAAFKAGQVRALVATDIAARGIDVDAVSHVINYELPNVPEAYVHRIGRTARAGAEGVAITLCADDERGLLKDIEQLIRQTIPSWDRRKDPALGALDAAIEAAKPAKKPTTPERGEAPRTDSGKPSRPRRPARDRTHHGERGHGERPHAERPAGGERNRQPRPTWDPLASQAASPPPTAAPRRPRQAPLPPQEARERIAGRHRGLTSSSPSPRLRGEAGRFRTDRASASFAPLAAASLAAISRSAVER